MNMMSENKLSYKHEPSNMVCKWCTGNHCSRKCQFEKLIKCELKTRVGIVMEQFVEKCIKCPRCSSIAGDYCDEETLCTFNRLANNTPSLDMECRICGLHVEVKSKCLSIDNLPNQIYCKAGNYDNLINNINENQLNIFVIIYSADRITKNITIKEILWMDHSILSFKSKVLIKRIPDTKLSDITIINRNNIPKLPFNIRNISFESYIKRLSEKIKYNDIVFNQNNRLHLGQYVI